jgi:hypothetical protein
MPGITDLLPGSAASRDLPPSIADALVEQQAQRLTPSRGVDVPAEYAKLLGEMQQPVRPPQRGVLGDFLMGFAAGPQAFQIQSQEAQQAQSINAQMKQHRLMLLNKLVDAEDKDDVAAMRATANQISASLKSLELHRKEQADAEKAKLAGKQGDKAAADAALAGGRLQDLQATQPGRIASTEAQAGLSAALAQVAPINANANLMRADTIPGLLGSQRGAVGDAAAAQAMQRMTPLSLGLQQTQEVPAQAAPPPPAAAPANQVSPQTHSLDQVLSLMKMQAAAQGKPWDANIEAFRRDALAKLGYK